MKKILHKVEPGGSPFGIHSYMAFLGCARKARLNEKLRESGVVDPLGSSEALRIGTLFHYFMEAKEKFKGSRFDAAAVEFSHAADKPLPINESERQQAQRLFVAWQAEYWDTPLGKTIAVEEIIEDSEAFGAIAGIRPITARLDRVFEVTAKDRARIKSAYGLDLKPGIYVQDYKTAASEKSSETETRNMEWQFKLYQPAAQMHYRLDYVPGLVCSSIYKTSTVKFTHRLIAPPTSIQAQGLRDMLQLAKAARESGAGYNPTACVDPFGGPCYFYTTGECKRTVKG